MDPNADIEAELLPFLRIYKDGRIDRLMGTTTIPSGVDAATGVASKDTLISPSTGVSARLYLPNPSSSSATTKLPVLIYFHGGAFIIESAFSPTYHTYLNALAAKSNLLIVSLDYRLAPEHPLPAAYDDGWDALRWVSTAADEWVAEHGDLSRVFVAGDSAGGNIAHNVVIRAGAEKGTVGVEIEGAVLIHPYFSGEKGELVEMEEEIWRVVCPGSSLGLGDPVISPPAAAGMGCRRVMVAVAERDSLMRRGVGYYESVKGSGWGGEAELVVTEEEGHVFHLFDPACDKAVRLMDQVVGFFDRG